MIHAETVIAVLEYSVFVQTTVQIHALILNVAHVQETLELAKHVLSQATPFWMYLQDDVNVSLDSAALLIMMLVDLKVLNFAPV
jgi:hypothetical protein